jgi:hypothetical protein
MLRLAGLLSALLSYYAARNGATQWPLIFRRTDTRGWLLEYCI